MIQPLEIEVLDKDTYDNYWVNKSNKLIHANYALTLNELKIMLILASRVQPHDQTFTRFTFKASDLAGLLNVTPQAMYKELPKIAKSLMSKQLNVKSHDGDYWVMVNLLSACAYRKKAGTVLLEFSPMLAPYLLELKSSYTRYQLKNILPLTSKYSIRLYELLKSHSQVSQRTLSISLEQFKQLLNLTQSSYKLYGSVKQKVIDVAVKEINEITDLSVTWEAERVGRQVQTLHFTISEKPYGYQPSKAEIPAPDPKGAASNSKAPTKSSRSTKKEEPFVAYLQVVVKQRTKKYFAKRDARIIEELVKQDEATFAPVLEFLHPKIENPTGFMIDFFKNPDKYQKPKPILRKELIKPEIQKPSMTEEEQERAIARMKELQKEILSQVPVKIL